MPSLKPPNLAENRAIHASEARGEYLPLQGSDRALKPPAPRVGASLRVPKVNVGKIPGIKGLGNPYGRRKYYGEI
jgi:hypothetical protein